MKIVISSPTKKFEHVKNGEVFVLDNTYYLKVGQETAFDFYKNEVDLIELNKLVEVVDCELVIK